MRNIIIETDRLILRKFSSKDLLDLYEYLSDPEVVEYEPYDPMTLDETKEGLKWRISSDEMIAIELKHNHKMIGNIYLGKRDFNALEIGYVINKNYWHLGYAKEACESLIKLNFEKGVHRIYAECDPDNNNSWKLLERLGFVREAFFRENIYFNVDNDKKPIWKNTYVYSLINNKR